MRIVMAWLVMAAVGWAQAAEPEKKEEVKTDGKEDVKKEEETPKPRKGEGVVVTAERMEVEQRLAPETYTIVKGREIEVRQQEDVHEALRFSPGVHIAETAGKGGLTSLFIRGGESDHALVLVDGVEVNSDGGGIDMAFLTTDGIDTVEIVRGAGSSVWGADAMSGVVHVITRRGEGPPRARFSQEWGRYGTWREKLSFGTGNDDYGFTFALSRYDRSNGRFSHSSYDNTTAVGRFDYALGKYTKIKATVRFANEQADMFAVDPGPRFAWEDRNGQKRATHFVLGLELVQRIMEGWTVTLRGGRFDQDVRFDNLGSFDYDSTSKFERSRLGAQTDAAVLDQENLKLVLSAGGEWALEELATSDSFSAGLGVNERRRSRGGFGQAKLEAWDRLGVILSGRVDQSTGYRTGYTGKFGVTYDIKETGTRPHASIANGIKTPTMVEVFSTNPFFLGNRDLRPEMSRTWDIGIEQRILGDFLLADVTFFENRMRRLVQFTGGTPAFENAGNALARGIEVAIAVKPVEWLRFDAGYTYQRTRVTHSSVTSVTFEERQPLIRRPDHAGFVGAALQLNYEDGIPKAERKDHPRVSASIRTRYVGRRDDVIFYDFPAPADRVKNPRYLKLDLAAEWWILDRNLRVFGGINNLFSRDYEDVIGYPNDRLTFIIGVEAAFELGQVFGVK
ncbi:MAG: TonB-dependent receptor [Planctomycetota bacterium]